MDIKNFLPRKDTKVEKEYFWSLVIEPGWVHVGIWRIEEDKAQVVLSSPSFVWELDEDLIQAVDSALSSAIKDFPEDLKELSKTVFGVSSSWVKEGQIAPEYLDKIKHLCTELSLTPIGFVVLPEAIAHLTKSEEGAPLNAIVLGVYKDVLDLTLFRLGNLVGTTQISRSVSVVDDVIEGLSRFQVSASLPSRILLYNGREAELEEIRQTLLKFNWDDLTSLKFLHTPKIEIVDARTKVYATSLAGASELGKVSSLEVIKREVEGPEHKVYEQEEFELKGGEVESSKKFDKENMKAQAESLGFVLEKDIKAYSEKTALTRQEEQPAQTYDEEDYKNFEEVSVEKFRGGALKKVLSSGFNLGKLWHKLSSFINTQFAPIKGFAPTGKRTFITGVVALFTFLAAGGAFWWFYPKATVTIYVSPKKLEEKFDLKVDIKEGTTDFQKRKIAGKIITAEASGDKTKDTTGTKTVGDKAKGEVTIYRVGSQVRLDKATVLIGPQGLKFTLDEDVTLASGSAGSPGTTKANVTAEDIGAQYNLAQGTTFSVGNYSATDMEAKNESAFSGGSSREITVISFEDQTVLEEDLSDELIDKAKQALLQKVGDDELVIDESISATSSAKTFSGKVGDEAENVRLSMTLKAEGVVVKRKVLTDLAVEVLKNKVPQGFVLKGEQIEFDFDLERRGEGIYDLEWRVLANLLPEVKTEEIVEKIRGKHLQLAEEILNREVPGFVRARIRINISFPGRLKTLPQVAKNIEVEIAAER